MRMLAVLLITGGATVTAAAAQTQPKTQQASGESARPAAYQTIEEINKEYARDLAVLERRRLDRLAALAARQEKAAADKTYETYLRLAISGGLFREAEPIAEQVLKVANPASPLAALATIVNLVAEADRGAYDESLNSLSAAIRGRAEGNASPALPLPRASRLSLADAYYQRLVQADQFDVARRAMRLIEEATDDPAIKEYAGNRLRQLNLLGKPAPPIAGSDLDGKPVALGDYRGDVVLVIFWATWYVPAAEDAERLGRLYDAYRTRRFRILAINVDTAQEGTDRNDGVLPNVRRFVLDHNVRWPNLINGKGDRDYAQAYGVTELPASFLIGRDGRVRHLDLTSANLGRAIEKATAD